VNNNPKTSRLAVRIDCRKKSHVRQQLKSVCSTYLVIVVDGAGGGVAGVLGGGNVVGGGRVQRRRTADGVKRRHPPYHTRLD